LSGSATSLPTSRIIPSPHTLTNRPTGLHLYGGRSISYNGVLMAFMLLQYHKRVMDDPLCLTPVLSGMGQFD
jgi:hypothetical protein